MIPGFRKCIFLITTRLARLKWRFLTGFCLMSLPSAIAIIAEFQKKIFKMLFDLLPGGLK